MKKEDWDKPPRNRWSFQHIREILPTTEVWRGTGPVWHLPREAADLDRLEFTLPSGDAITIEAWLERDFTDGFIVLHRGSIVYERYLNAMNERTLHLSQSVAKSIAASVVGVLREHGLLNPEELITTYLPELKRTAWNGATLQQVLDMTTGVKFDEEYTSTRSDIAKVDVCSGWKPPQPGQNLPGCIWDLILTFKEQECPHGERFKYRSIETDVMAHAMERVSGMKLAGLISRELWSKLGAEESACYTVDAAGYALADGGFNATLRDYARFGQMIHDGGIADGRRVIPYGWIADCRKGQHQMFGEPYSVTLPEGAYHNQFWLESPARRTLMARGVFGQLIYICPDDEMVIVKLASWPEFLSNELALNAFAAISAIAAELKIN
ncbi:MAG: serine hydrolase domain-containing protein [Hyphomicrobiales bacterium]